MLSQNFAAGKKDRVKKDHRSPKIIKKVCDYLCDHIKFNIGNVSIGANVHNLGCSDKKSKRRDQEGLGGGRE